MKTLRTFIILALLSFASHAQANICTTVLSDQPSLSAWVSDSDKAFLEKWKGETVFHDELATLIKDFNLSHLSESEIEQLISFTENDLKSSDEVSIVRRNTHRFLNFFRQIAIPYDHLVALLPAHRSTFFATHWDLAKVNSWNDVHDVLRTLMQKEFAFRMQQSIAQELEGTSAFDLTKPTVREATQPHSILSKFSNTAPLLVQLVRLRLEFERRYLLLPDYSQPMNPMSWLNPLSPVLTSKVRELAEQGDYQALEDYFAKSGLIPDLAGSVYRNIARITLTIGLSGAVVVGIEFKNLQKFYEQELYTYEHELSQADAELFQGMLDAYSTLNPEATIEWIDSNNKASPEMQLLAESLRKELTEQPDK